MTTSGLNISKKFRGHSIYVRFSCLVLTLWYATQRKDIYGCRSSKIVFFTKTTRVADTARVVNNN